MAKPEAKSAKKIEVKSPLGLHVTAYVGDIMDALADAIVTPEDKTMSHPSFVTRALIKQDILFEMDREDLRKRKLSFPLWTVCTSKMKEQTVYHAFLAACRNDDVQQWTINMKKLYNNLFREADKNGSLVIAMPLLGAGISNIEEAVTIAVSSVATFKPKTLTDVLFVSTDEYIIENIVSQCLFEFEGRPQADKTKRSVSFKLSGEDEDEDDEEAKSKPRSKHKGSKPKGGKSRRGRGVKVGAGRMGRRGSNSSLQSNESDISEVGRRSRRRTSPKKSVKTRRTGIVQNGKTRAEMYEEIMNEESSDDIKKYKTYKKVRKVKYSSSSSEEGDKTDDENVVRLSMKGSKVSVNGKTYDMNVQFEGSPVLKSARDVKEKVVGQTREIQQPKATPREEQKPANPHKPKTVPKPYHYPKTKPIPKSQVPKAPAAQSVPKLNLTQVEPDASKDVEQDSSRRTKSAELGRTRKRSQSLAAKVAEELEVLRAEHAMKSSEPSAVSGVPSVLVKDESDGPVWTGGKGHIFTPQANALSKQNRSSWSSEEDEGQGNEARHINDVSDCPICSRVARDPKTLDKCKHVFCRECIDDSFAAYKPVCPCCNTVYGVITGNQPEGKMDVALSDERLPGYNRYDTVVITYTFPDGTQGQEHPDPGEPYKGTTRKAYLPNNTKGTEVLRLLRTAFKRKLIFTIVRSGVEDESNIVTWNDIHHKTSMKGGPTRFGYPDKTYLAQVKDELAKKGVTD